MSRYIATRAIRGAGALVTEAEMMLQKALAEKGSGTPVAFPNTAYYLPVIYGLTGQQAKTLGDLETALKKARSFLHPIPSSNHWTPYLGETLDCGIATLFAAEVIEAIRFVYNLQPEPLPGFQLANSMSSSGSDNGRGVGHLNGPIDDIQLRTWGIQLVDGRMPGFAAIIGAAQSNEVAVKIVRELQRRNILCFLSGNVNGRSIIHQLLEEGVELGYDTYTVPFGTDTLSAIYALGFAVRSALTFGGLKGGMPREILTYNKQRVFAFVLALGEVDDLKYAAAAGAINFGFPVIADTVIPEILPTGITTYEHVVSMPFNEIGANEGITDPLDRAERLVQKCIEVRGIKLRMAEVPVPVPYGSAFEGEVVRKADMRVEFGGKYSRCFEYLQMAPLEKVMDGRVEIIGPGFEDVPPQGHIDLGILVEVAGRKMQEEFEPVLERQIHYFINGASGVQHIGQRDITWIRISKTAYEKGFNLEHLGKIMHARLHADFGAIVDKVQVTLFTDQEKIQEWLLSAREAYNYRNKRLASQTDDAVSEFYSCTLCQSFAPNHVCVVSPERLGLCGAYNWLDCKASFSINPTGPNQPIKLGKLLDAQKGYWTGTIEYARAGSHGAVEVVSMYSIMENPMTACGCFECIVVFVPEVNGVMVVSREDTSMTPAGMTFSTLAGIAGGGVQTPGVMGVGKYYLISPKFISADGGFRRVVWMSSILKESMRDEFEAVAEREGIPDLIDRIADERLVTEVSELVDWANEMKHPAMDMPPMDALDGEDISLEAEHTLRGEEVLNGGPELVPAEGSEAQEQPFAKEQFPSAEGLSMEDKEILSSAAQLSAGGSQETVVAVPAESSAERAVIKLRRALLAALAVLDGDETDQISAGSPRDTSADIFKSLEKLAEGLEGDAAVRSEEPDMRVDAPSADVKIEKDPEAVLEDVESVVPARNKESAWMSAETQTEVIREQWPGAICEVTLGATSSDGGTRKNTVTIGGERAMPFMHFEGKMPHPPAIAVEIMDRKPVGWSPLLIETWGEVLNDPALWAKAAQDAGADLIFLRLSLTDEHDRPSTPDDAVRTVQAVLKASDLPLIVVGPGQVDVDNELLVPISDACKGERLLLGVCEDKNYGTIVASALANDHLVIALSPMDVNLAKQLNILINDMGMPMDRIIMDPTTGALGYGFEYGYSVMERLRLTALQGDRMTQQPMLVTPGYECWKTKEAKVGAGVPEAWGAWSERAITWETVTSVMLIEAGANIVVLRHPDSVRRTRTAITDLMRMLDTSHSE
ncbi:MAG: acetyl-CoA decarbonylase/synthase complex subunit alpha/beta [Anaerolineaceae bacterium]|nr:acetyl-CoA decarbonylase/synthase complex subunit alpha/beta [Anaerolineaceae bacterium]